MGLADAFEQAGAIVLRWLPKILDYNCWTAKDAFPYWHSAVLGQNIYKKDSRD